MFCEKCGSEIPESVICPKCGCKSGYIDPKSVPDRKDTIALIGMILGIASIFLNRICIVAVAGLIVSIKGLKSKRKKGMAIAGIICSCISIVLFIAFIISFFVFRRVYIAAY
ncbi:MAG: hypothetical protein ACI4JN_03515 [Ruminococcus sp.]